MGKQMMTTKDITNEDVMGKMSEAVRFAYSTIHGRLNDTERQLLETLVAVTYTQGQQDGMNEFATLIQTSRGYEIQQ